MLIFKSLQYKHSLLLVLVFMLSCNQKKQVRNVKAQIIEYKVEYLADKVGEIPTSVLPRKMELIFSGSYALNRIEGFMGQFSLTYIADLEDETVITLLKIFDRKYFYKGVSGELPVGIDKIEGMRIAKGTNTMDIAGVKSNELILSIPGKEDISIYSTKEIEVKSPNITTQYRDEKNVLVSFYTSLSNMEMMLTAQKTSEKIISNKIFFIPEDFRRISRNSMEEAIHELFK